MERRALRRRASKSTAWHPRRVREAACRQAAAGLWSLGVPEIDRRLGAAGLDAAGVHEKPPLPAPGHSTAAGWASAITFSLRLAVRRLEAVRALRPSRPRPLLWCWPAVLPARSAASTAPASSPSGLIPPCSSSPRRRGRRGVWAIEEALRSGAVALVLGASTRSAHPGAPLEPGRAILLHALPPCQRPALSPDRRHREPLARRRGRERSHPFDPPRRGPAAMPALERRRSRPVAGIRALHRGVVR